MYADLIISVAPGRLRFFVARLFCQAPASSTASSLTCDDSENTFMARQRTLLAASLATSNTRQEGSDVGSVLAIRNNQLLASFRNFPLST